MNNILQERDNALHMKEDWLHRSERERALRHRELDREGAMIDDLCLATSKLQEEAESPSSAERSQP